MVAGVAGIIADMQGGLMMCATITQCWYNLRALYRELKEDPRYTDEHKAQKAWERYEATKEKIVAGKVKAKELLENQASMTPTTGFAGGLMRSKRPSPRARL